MKKRIVDFEPADCNKSATHNIKASSVCIMRTHSTETAKLMVGDITQGMNIFGFNKGQFSLSNLIEHILNEIGQADVLLCTWTANKSGLEKAFDFLNNQKIKSLKLIIDSGFKSLNTGAYKYLISKFGVDCIRTCRVHVKFVLFKTERFKLVLRSSMNLNKNIRLESFELTENVDFYDYIVSFFYAIFNSTRGVDNFNVKSNKDLNQVFFNFEKTKSCFFLDKLK